MEFDNILFPNLLYNDMEIDLLLSVYGANTNTINNKEQNEQCKFIFNKE